MPFLQTKRLNIYFEEAGEGEKLLYIGGVCGDLRSRPNGLTNLLKDSFHVLAFDQRGTGQTEKPACEYTIADYVEDTIALMDAKKWNNAYIVGVSFGGMVAQELALKYPDRVKALALACTTAGGAGGSSYPIHELSDLPANIKSRKMMGIADIRRSEEWQDANPKKAERLLAESAKNASPFLAEPGGLDGFTRQIHARSKHNTYDRLENIHTPAFVLAGRYDGQAKMEAVENLYNKLPNARMQVFEGGHTFLSQDTAAFPAIRDFFLSV